MKFNIKSLAIAASFIGGSISAHADEIKFLCFGDGVECEFMGEIAQDFKAATGHTVDITQVSYNVIREQLENQLQSGSGPDVARVTDLGGLNKYYLDLKPYVDVDYWEESYGATLPWFRAPGGEDNGIYGWMSQLTVTGPYVNVTMFDDAGVDMPGDGATWDDWIAALRDVKDALGMDAAFGMDRTGHRWAGPAFSYGAKYFDESGAPILVDEGFRTYAKNFVQWHKDGLMPQEGWPAGSGTKLRSAAPLFQSGNLAMYMSGSWQIPNFDKNITDFVWKAVPAPCGPGGCGSVPGGAAVVAFKDTKHPEAAAAWIDFLAQTENTERMAAVSKNITAHQGLQKSGVDYGNVSPAVSQALSTFAENASKAAETTPQGYALQGYPKNFVIHRVIPEYLTRAITGEMDLDAALAAIDKDVAAKIAE